MRILPFTDPATYAQRVTPLLMRREAENNFILGKISEFESGHALPPDTLLLSLEDDSDGDQPVAAALMMPPNPLVVTRAPADAVEALVGHLAQAGVRPRAVSGPEPTSAAFTKAWSAATGIPHRSEFRMGLYQLTRLVPPARPVPGSFRAAGEADVDFLVPWAEAFFREIQHFTAPHAATRVPERLRRRQHYLWCDPPDRPVSLAGWAGPTPNGVRINSVYTPPEHRGRGYATACVASLTRHLLDSGRKFCFLFTDAANPTSNGIYRRLGYEHVCDLRDVRFE
jgi:predicted GNAT family acetyltransferase